MSKVIGEETQSSATVKVRSLDGEKSTNVTKSLTSGGTLNVDSGGNTALKSELKRKDRIIADLRKQLKEKDDLNMRLQKNHLESLEKLIKGKNKS